MKVLRHEEFEKGCEATCNGPYDGRWSKTMIGYGPEDNKFVLELTYNYGVSTYRHGNCLEAIEIEKQAVDLDSYAAVLGRDAVAAGEDGALWVTNNGYKFKIIPSTKGDKISRVSIRTGTKESTHGYHVKFYESILGMKVLNSEFKDEALLSYGDNQATLCLQAILNGDPIEHGTAFGRMAFSCPTNRLTNIQESVELVSYGGEECGAVPTAGVLKPKVLTPLISLDTPGKATVSVVIIADLSGHEICFVGDEGFRQLSKVDEKADAELAKSIEQDKSDEWFAKHGKTKEEAA